MEAITHAPALTPTPTPMPGQQQHAAEGAPNTLARDFSFVDDGDAQQQRVPERAGEGHIPHLVSQMSAAAAAHTPVDNAPPPPSTLPLPSQSQPQSPAATTTQAATTSTTTTTTTTTTDSTPAPLAATEADTNEQSAADAPSHAPTPSAPTPSPLSESTPAPVAQSPSPQTLVEEQAPAAATEQAHPAVTPQAPPAVTEEIPLTATEQALGPTTASASTPTQGDPVSQVAVGERAAHLVPHFPVGEGAVKEEAPVREGAAEEQTFVTEAAATTGSAAQPQAQPRVGEATAEEHPPAITADFFNIDGVDDAVPQPNMTVPTAGQVGTLTNADLLPDAEAAMHIPDLPEGQVVPGDPLADPMGIVQGPGVLASLEQPEFAVPDDMEAFAKLSFPDGDFYVHTYAVELGRDVKAHKGERRRGKQQKRRERREQKEQMERQRQAQQGAIADAAAAAGQDEAMSPRDDGSTSFDHRNHGTAMSVSNISEIGGILGAFSSDEGSQASTRRRKKKKHLRSNASSHSLDPTTLSANPQDLMQIWDDPPPTPPRGLPEGLPDHAYQCPLIPIHPQTGASFKGISRRHVRIEYSLDKGYWEMFVTGRNTVFHNNDKIETGGSARLYHGSEIIIQTITITFKLPDNARDNQEEEAVQEVYDSDSPLSDLADDFDEASSDDDVPLRIRRPSPPKRKVIKLKLNRHKMAQKFPSTSSSKKEKSEKPEKSSKTIKLSSKAPKIAKVEKLDKDENAEAAEKKDRADKAEKAAKAEKERERLEKIKAEKIDLAEKAKALEKEISIPLPEPAIMPPPSSLPADVKMSVEDIESSILALKTTPGPSETPPAVPAELPAGSVLVGVAPEDIPAKRKGPGRPPKNGVMSKRDEAIIKRLTKELQKQGKPVPNLNELLLMARAEGTTTKKDKGDEKDGFDGKSHLEGSITPGPMIDPSIIQSIEGMASSTPQAASQASPDNKDTKPKRIVRTPSPQKPESEYTEEELKKPTQTYVVLIHEALTKAANGVMDLQQIYDAMQKMYPFFKYRAGTSGWQSSVRHNLISSEAFQEAGKIGKGRLWKINPDVSIDKEKKRKAPTPPPQQQPQYPYYANNGQYPYGAPQQQQGYSPYPRPSPYGTPYGNPAAQPGARPPVPAGQKPGAYYSPYASNPAGAHASPYGPPSRPPYASAYAPQNQGQPNTGQPPPPGQSPYGQPPQVGQQPSQTNGQPPAQGQQTNGQPAQQGKYQPHQNSQPPPQGQYQGPPNGQYTPQPNAPGNQQQQGQYQQQSGQFQTSQNGQPNQYAPQQNGQQSYQPSPSQPPPPLQQPPLPPPPTTVDITKALTAIMTFQTEYVAGFSQGKGQEEARAMFTKVMPRGINGDFSGGFDNKAEEDLTKKIAEIYAQSREPVRPVPLPQQQTLPPPPPPQQQGGSQYSSAAPTPSPAPTAPMQNTAPVRPPSQQPVNNTPAPPQGNIPARYLPPQYNPQGASNPPQSQPKTQGQQQPQQQQQQPKQGSSSEAHLAQALRAAMPGASTPQPHAQSQVSAPATPAQGQYSQPPPSQSQHQQPSPYSQHAPSPSPYNSSNAPTKPPSQSGTPAPAQGRPPSQGLPQHSANANMGHAVAGVTNSVQQQRPPPPPPSNNQSQTPAPQASMQASPAQPPGQPGQQVSSQQQQQGSALSRPTFTPSGANGVGQQANKMPPRPTFAPSPVVGAGGVPVGQAPSSQPAVPQQQPTPGPLNGPPHSVPSAPAPAPAPAPTPAPAAVPAAPSVPAAAEIPAQNQTHAQTQVPPGSAPNIAQTETQKQVPAEPQLPAQTATPGGSLKRPISLDDDANDGPSDAKKQKVVDGGGSDAT